MRYFLMADTIFLQPLAKADDLGDCALATTLRPNKDIKSSQFNIYLRDWTDIFYYKPCHILYRGASVYAQYLSGYIGGIVGGKESNCIGNILRSAEPP